DEVALTVASGYAEYTVPTVAVPADESLSEVWQIQLSLTLDGVVHKYPVPMHVVRWVLSCPVAPAKMTGRHVELADLLTTAAAQGHIANAWIWVQQELLQQERMPWRILDANSLQRPVLWHALHLAFLDLHASVGGAGKYGELADYYEKKAELAFGKVRVTYDEDDDGKPDAGESGTAAVGAAFLGGPGVWPI
ncbi:MAG: hypothetical protein GY871_06685, partial [Actinomycetales bacterium]|nr:hypothetical protein [Actinomycetales bacterium]